MTSDSMKARKRFWEISSDPTREGKSFLESMNEMWVMLRPQLGTGKATFTTARRDSLV